MSLHVLVDCVYIYYLFMFFYLFISQILGWHQVKARVEPPSTFKYVLSKGFEPQVPG